MQNSAKKRNPKEDVQISMEKNNNNNNIDIEGEENDNNNNSQQDQDEVERNIKPNNNNKDSQYRFTNRQQKDDDERARSRDFSKPNHQAAAKQRKVEQISSKKQSKPMEQIDDSPFAGKPLIQFAVDETDKTRKGTITIPCQFDRQWMESNRPGTMEQIANIVHSINCFEMRTAEKQNSDKLSMISHFYRLAFTKTVVYNKSDKSGPATFVDYARKYDFRWDSQQKKFKIQPMEADQWQMAVVYQLVESALNSVKPEIAEMLKDSLLASEYQGMTL